MGKPLSILIIEDSESDAELICRQLGKDGFLVSEKRIETTDQMQSALQDRAWDVIIADYQLPEFNAPSALAVLQATGLDIPFVVVSGAVGEENAVTLMRLGACDYLMKDNLARLSSVVQRELIEAQVRREGRQAELALQQETEASRQRAHELEMITGVSAGMRQASTREELVEIILRRLMAMLNMEHAALALLKSETLLFELAFSRDRAWQKQRMAVDRNPLGDVIRTGQPVIVDRIDEAFWRDLPAWICEVLSSAKSAIIFPLRSRQHTIGLFLLGCDRVVHFDHKQLSLVAAAADMAGNALNRMAAAEELENMVARREAELEGIFQVASAASKTLDLYQALLQALDLTLVTVRAEMGGVFLLDETATRADLTVFQTLEPVRSAVVYQDTLAGLFRDVIAQKKIVSISEQAQPSDDSDRPDNTLGVSYVGLPMTIQGRMIGVLGIGREGGMGFADDEITLLSFIAGHLALVVENTQLYKKAEHSAVLEERSRLARELHDSVTQSLYSANLYSVGAQRYAAQGNYTAVDSYLAQIGFLTQQALKDMRLLVYELRSPELAQNGLLGALQNRLDAVERRSKIKVELVTNGPFSLPERIEENLYRIAIEALNNALKHAKASQVRVELTQTENMFCLAVQDNGAGFRPESGSSRGGVGLATMRERSENIGGSLQISSEPGSGTRIEVTLPAQPGQRLGKGDLR